jgi:hypothetical protein
LSAADKFEITVPTRNPDSASARSISALPNVVRLEADYETEAGMRMIFQGQDAVYFNINSFSISEPYEYFWTFHAYEIAVQSKLKLFVLSAGSDRYRLHGYDERFRNCHVTVKERLAEWLSHQPLDILPRSIAQGGVYAEMLWSFLRPRSREDGLYGFSAPIGDDGTIPFVPLDDYGIR